MAIGAVTGISLFVWDWQKSRLEQGYFLERPLTGEGAREEKLQIQTPYGEQEIEVLVGERKLQKEEIREQLQLVSGELGTLILGENESLDEVRKPLNLLQEMEDLPVYLEWSVEEDGPVNRDGTLNQENLPEDGILTELTVQLQWEEEALVSRFTARVYPPALTEEEKFMQTLQEEIEKKDEESQNKLMQELPGEAAGKSLDWNRSVDTRGIWVLVLAVMGAVLQVISYHKEEKDKQEKRRAQMEMDYPEIVSKLKLYMEAGFTCRAAWIKIAGDYQEKQKKQGTSRYAYEEMVKTGFEMRSGVSEQRAYERFGERCKVPCYKKLAGLLIQNINKGNRGLGELLEAEMWQAFEERKALAKKQGEEAGTKMLFPMMGLLAVVMVIVIAPALMSMQI